ncbi:hypothetical protein Ae406Ps2_3898c [Pseudonocardia sp. Ae406_Ps2]|nr:hypothetical protein Ae331Ps2_2050 [Pseudonocardia sp. Ae331_Ps2]OLM03898.1 hypothetical protein Ae406Ps2_3898c [Pseudonocardia sp. Ae406_Ps2]OLM11262.1 hypothetical protein Ae505Ps2_1385 [Pseudonocardia sp. Ae505_Ps2]OLM25453.1 hypothetical protein Ae706Ps2_3886c [Pseudonocardia sp. Ae706_Ps2]
MSLRNNDIVEDLRDGGAPRRCRDARSSHQQ